MGVYIKNMEMPEICDMCPLLAFIEEDEDHDAFCYCILSNWKKSCTPDPMTIREARRFRRLDCPLIEVSTPHGRLIDADTLKETMKIITRTEVQEIVEFDRNAYKVDDASTIIPAEESE